MLEIQQIIEALGCFTTNQHSCVKCPFNPHPGMQWTYGCIKGQGDIIEAAQKALKKYMEVMDCGKTAIDGQRARELDSPQRGA